MDKKKMGRPTDNPKGKDVRVRVTEDVYQKILEYSERNSQTASETIREALEGFFDYALKKDQAKDIQAVIEAIMSLDEREFKSLCERLDIGKK